MPRGRLPVLQLAVSQPSWLVAILWPIMAQHPHLRTINYMLSKDILPGSFDQMMQSARIVKQFCLSFEDQTVMIDLFFNAFFLLYFGLRFLAASDKLTFWLELNSVVDFFTITPVCVSFYLGRNWLGLRFLRALRLMELPKILQFLHITTSGTAIKLSKLLAVFVSTWLTAAGFLHWMENSGDPWVQEKNSQNLTYFECLYLIMVTMSTVGYGDVVVKTSLGRAFILFFIVGGLILFANLVPEIVDIVGSTKLYKGSYIAVKGRKYIVVCGDINLNSVTAFLRDFLNHSTGEVATEIIFLGENPPSLELETIFRCYAAYISFFQGTVMKSDDLVRVQQMGNAEACLILADTCSAQPYIEDTSNIMRVLSIKNHYPHTRVIIQIIQSSNKVYLPKLPNWDWRKGDSIICFSELKLGLIAQSCVVPGLTTILTSLFIREGIQKVKTLHKHQEEVKGQEYKVMTQLLSNTFVDMSFKDVCWLCFVKLNLILLAIEFRSSVHGNSILINPTSMIQLHSNTMGFFIAKSTKELRRARYYCKQCHSDIKNPDQIGKCRCKANARRTFSVSGKFKALQDFLSLPDQYPASSRTLGIPPLSNLSAESERLPEVLEEQSSETPLDSTGMFHWCEAVPFEKALLRHNKKLLSSLRDHIVVCVFGDATSTLIGLRNFVMPLRASNFTFSELKYIVFLGSLEYLQREWEFIQNFPKLALLKGSALSCADLKAANIKYCAMCVIISAHARGTGDQTLVDTKSILATLNIRSLQFKLSPSSVIDYVRKSEPFSVSAWKEWESDNLNHFSHTRMAWSYRCEKNNTFDCDLFIGNNLEPCLALSSKVSTDKPSQDTMGNQSMPIFSKRIPIITELKIASNAQFFEQRSGADDCEYFNQNVSQNFSRGTIFSDSFLDSLLCTTYHNHHVLALLQTLVTGGTSPELEELLAEETLLSGSSSNVVHVGPRNRCKLALLALADSSVSIEGLLVSFGDVYTTALDILGILCFGLYRLKDDPNPYENRKV
ncbi:Potassium channel subfamily U member 1 [Varanus komodoensis]|nr:Potassium channel subfamily U member 1 [Varanus komodoensis]